MGVLLRIAWKNIWRNKRRSLVMMAALACGLWGGLFSWGIMQGMADAMVNTAIDRDITHIQIHAPSYREEKSFEQSLVQPERVLVYLRSLPVVLGVSARTFVEGMASSATQAVGVRIVGIDPTAETRITSLPRSIKEGNFFLPLPQKPSLVIGRKLAEKLRLHLRSKIILTFQSADGTLVTGAFRIVGIYQTESSLYDATNVFIPHNQLASLLGTETVHEIAIRLTSHDSVAAVTNQLQRQFPNLDIQSWKELAPELKLTAESTALYMNIFLGIILFALLFGITNTMLMSVHDRIREFGMLIAIGMKRHLIFLLVLFETILLSFAGALAGMFLGWGTVAITFRTGIDLSYFSEGLSLYGIPGLLYPVVPAETYGMLAVMVMATALLAALYPAVRVIRLQPVEAMRTKV